MSTGLYVFDFDGVLFDTAHECLAIAFDAATAAPERWPFAARWAGAERPPADVAEAFLRLRYWVGPPWQYAVLLQVIADGEIPSDTESFLERCTALKTTHEGFEREYFAARGRLAQDEARWLREIVPVESACRIFEALGEDALILSTRDPGSIACIFASVRGLQVPPARILPRAGAREKFELLHDLAASTRQAPAAIFFLDDYVSHALPARQAGFASYLAGWGYLGPDDRHVAASQGLPVLDLEALGSTISQHRASTRHLT